MEFSPVIKPMISGLNSHWQSGVLLLISGAIYPLAFSPFNFWPLIFVSLIPLLWALTSRCILSPFKIGFFWGMGANAVGSSWVYVSIHEFGFVPAFGAALLTLLFVTILAIYKGLFAYFCWQLLNRSHRAMLLLIAPFCWLLGEYLQAILFGGFPWLIAGYSQIDSPLAPLATWLGVYGISWMILSLAACLVLLSYSWKNRAMWACMMILLSLVVVAGLDASRNQTRQFASQNFDIALVQPNIPQEKKWDRAHFSSIINILFDESTSLWGADLLVWPDLEKLGRQNNTQVLLGIPEYEAEAQQSYVSLLALGKENLSYHKQVLVPFGEYVPLQDWLRGLIQFLDLPMSGFTPGQASQAPLIFPRVNVIPAICYEIVYPDIVRQLAINADQSKPQLIVTVSNDAWFGDSFGPYQHMQMARMRALELGLPLIRATNDGITAVVDIEGNVLKQLVRYKQGSLRYKLPLENRQTRYRIFGNWGIGLVLGLSIVIIFWSFSRRGG